MVEQLKSEKNWMTQRYLEQVKGLTQRIIDLEKELFKEKQQTLEM